MLATSDMPVKSIENDYFGLKKYVLGMAAFAKNCDTPTSIAVQGDWGSGKTSMLNMVREELGDQVLSIWFNTWQFSKFSIDDERPLSLLSNLNMALEKAAPENGDKENTVKEILEDLNSFPFEEFLNAEDTEHADILKNEFSEVIFEEQDFEMEQAFQFLRQMCRMIADSQNRVIEKNVEKMVKVFNISSNTNGERIRKKAAVPVLTDNLTMEKTVGTTDVKYKILTAGVKFHVGFGEQVTMVSAGKEYTCKMHKTIKGRIGSLRDFYKDTALEKGDVCVLDYDIAQKRIVCTIRRKNKGAARQD